MHSSVPLGYCLRSNSPDPRDVVEFDTPTIVERVPVKVFEPPEHIVVRGKTLTRREPPPPLTSDQIRNIRKKPSPPADPL